MLEGDAEGWEGVCNVEKAGDVSADGGIVGGKGRIVSEARTATNRKVEVSNDVRLDPISGVDGVERLSSDVARSRESVKEGERLGDR